MSGIVGAKTSAVEAGLREFASKRGGSIKRTPKGTSDENTHGKILGETYEFVIPEDRSRD
jgi:hypothetical protein